MITLAADLARRRRWQHDGMIALLELLAASSQAQPPPIPWTLLTVGTLIGRAEGLDQVRAWADLLDAAVSAGPSWKGSDTYRCDTL
jgi:hypothetical protein